MYISLRKKKYSALVCMCLLEFILQQQGYRRHLGFLCVIKRFFDGLYSVVPFLSTSRVTSVSKFRYTIELVL